MCNGQNRCLVCTCTVSDQKDMLMYLWNDIIE